MVIAAIQNLAVTYPPMLTDTINIMQRFMIGGLWFGLSLSSAFAAGKDGPSIYQVEVLIFAVNDAAALASESWPEMYETGSTGPFLYITAADAGGKAAPASKEVPSKKPAALTYQFLGHDQLKLAASIAKLKKNPRYEVLLHTAWRQPAIDLKNETAVYVFNGMTEPEHAVEPLPSADSTPGISKPTVVLPPHVGTNDLANPEPRAPRLSGTIKLALGQYLHVALDLFYRKEMGRIGSVDASGKEVLTTHNALQSFRLNEIRRIKTGEVNYFDHPVFGALVLITSTEKTKAGDVEKETVGADSPAPKVLPED